MVYTATDLLEEPDELVTGGFACLYGYVPGVVSPIPVSRAHVRLADGRVVSPDGARSMIAAGEPGCGGSRFARGVAAEEEVGASRLVAAAPPNNCR